MRDAEPLTPEEVAELRSYVVSWDIPPRFHDLAVRLLAAAEREAEHRKRATGICSAHQHAECPSCDTCFPDALLRAEVERLTGELTAAQAEAEHQAKNAREYALRLDEVEDEMARLTGRVAELELERDAHRLNAENDRRKRQLSANERASALVRLDHAEAHARRWKALAKRLYDDCRHRQHRDIAVTRAVTAEARAERLEGALRGLLAHVDDCECGPDVARPWKCALCEARAALSQEPTPAGADARDRELCASCIGEGCDNCDGAGWT